MGKTELHFIPRSFKAQDYMDFLREKAVPDLTRLYPHKFRPPILLQDGEGFHTAKKVQKFLSESVFQSIAPWPSHSPDLNWKENVWEMLMQGVRKRNPTTFDGLKEEMMSGIPCPTIGTACDPCRLDSSKSSNVVEDRQTTVLTIGARWEERDLTVVPIGNTER